MYNLILSYDFSKLNSPFNWIILLLSLIFVFQIFKEVRFRLNKQNQAIYKPCIKKQDMTLKQLHVHDGTDGKSILIALNGKIFDVTPRKDYYGPQGPYGIFAGRDVTRVLAKFSLTEIADSPRDLSDLSALEMDSVREWELQFHEKYYYVGRLIGENDEPIDYSANESFSETANIQGAQRDANSPPKCNHLEISSSARPTRHRVTYETDRPHNVIP